MCAMNPAVTARLAVAATVHWFAAGIESQPLQLANDEPAAAVAVSVTEAASTKAAEHVAPQVMPAGVDVIVPDPVPIFAAVIVYVICEKLAVIDFAASIVTWHVPVPVHAPLQPLKLECAAGVAVSVTGVSALYGATHV